MIVEFVIVAFLEVAGFILGGISSLVDLLPEVPDSWADSAAEVGGLVGGFGGILPVVELATALAAVVAFLLFNVVVKLVRLCLSLFTGGGGSV